MKKLFKNTVFKTIAIFVAIGTVFYFLYQYLKSKTASVNPNTGNQSPINSDNNFDIRVATPIEQLFERAKNAEDVTIEFSEDMILKDDFGKTFEVKKGKVIKGKLGIIIVTGGTITATNSKYYLLPLDIYGIKRVEIDGSKVVAILDLAYYNKIEARMIS